MPEPKSNVCPFCTPRIMPGPSGRKLRHAFNCSDKPGQPISAAEYAKSRVWTRGFRGTSER